MRSSMQFLSPLFLAAFLTAPALLAGCPSATGGVWQENTLEVPGAPTCGPLESVFWVDYTSISSDSTIYLVASTNPDACEQELTYIADYQTVVGPLWSAYADADGQEDGPAACVAYLTYLEGVELYYPYTDGMCTWTHSNTPSVVIGTHDLAVGTPSFFYPVSDFYLNSYAVMNSCADVTDYASWQATYAELTSAPNASPHWGASGGEMEVSAADGDAYRATGSNIPIGDWYGPRVGTMSLDLMFDPCE